MEKIHIIGGGTVFHVRPHLAISAPAYGETAKMIAHECSLCFDSKKYEIVTHLTKMASPGESNLKTNDDIKILLEEICGDTRTKIIFLPVALCDFEGYIIENNTLTKSGKNQPRLKSRAGDYSMQLKPSNKLITSLKKQRGDILLVGFKTTAGASIDETITAAQKLLKDADCNYVFANDIHNRINLIIGQNGFISETYNDREEAIKKLVLLISK